MSFALTTKEVRAQTKTVTRRLGWTFLRYGDLLQPIVKGQGLKRGEHPRRIGRSTIRVLSTRRERLCAMLANAPYAWQEVRREGFGIMQPTSFVEMFCKHNHCTPETVITRIEFEYVRTRR